MVVRPRSYMRDYQVRASDKLYKGVPCRDHLGNYRADLPVRDGTAVHIDMGLGKTIIGLTAIVDWFTFGIISRPVLIVAPIKVCETVWRQEAQQWQHTRHLTFSLIRGDEKKRAFALAGVMNPGAKPCHVYLTNPEQLQWLTKYIRSEWGIFGALLIDESSMFKDSRAKRFRCLTNYGTRIALKNPDGSACRDAEGNLVLTPPHRFSRSGVLTGTPSPSSLMNLWAPMYILDHGTRLHKKFETFQSRFFHKGQQVAAHVHKYELNAEEDDVRPEYIARDQAPERIHELMADVTVELNAEDYGVLPETIGDLAKGDMPPSHVHYVDLPANIRPMYDQLEKDAIMEMAHDVVMAANGGAKSMMCWQICNGAMYVTDDMGRKSVAPMHDEKIEKLLELVETLNTNCVITYFFKHDLERIKAAFQKYHVSYTVLAGNKSEKIIKDWNDGKIANLLLHPQSAGHGINLQFGGHSIIWFTMLWSLERWLQTNARLARSGQSNIVGIHSIVARNTTDEMRVKNLGMNGSDQERFRSALRSYQQLRGLGIYGSVPSPQFMGLGI